MPSFLYKITNLINNKIYIGITDRPHLRMREHFYGKPGKTISLIKKAIQKYGPENFTFELLCEGSRDYIVELEKKAIIAYNSISYGYNIRFGGVDCGSGHKILKRKDDQPIFVTGFWFPNVRVCLEKLKLNKKSIYKWKKEGTLGDVQHLRTDSVKYVPCYVGGFWFDSIVRASSKLNQKISTLKKRIKTGNIEQKNQKTFKTGIENHMTGKKGFLHHRSKAVKINDIIYGSISQAAENTEFTKKMIYTRVKNKTPGFSWV